jgi:hypothetical protein
LELGHSMRHWDVGPGGGTFQWHDSVANHHQVPIFMVSNPKIYVSVTPNFMACQKPNGVFFTALIQWRDRKKRVFVK